MTAANGGMRRVSGWATTLLLLFALPAVAQQAPESSSTTPDVITPGVVGDLTAGATTEFPASSAQLRWTAPGDDGNSGTAHHYEIRTSSSAIRENTWNTERLIQNPPTPMPAGTVQTFIVTGLVPGQLYHFSVRAFDEFGNASPLSKGASYRLPADESAPLHAAAQVFIVDAETPDPITAQVWTDRLHLAWRGFLDTESGIAEYRLRLFELASTGLWVNRRNVTVPALRTQQKLSVVLRENGTYRVSVSAENRAGKASLPVFSQTVRVLRAGPPPETAITRGPSNATSERTASFEFTTSQKDARFYRSLDNRSWLPCEKTLTLSDLPFGAHSLRVISTYPAGNPDPTPATYSWIIDPNAREQLNLTLPEGQSALQEGDSLKFSYTLQQGTVLKSGVLRVHLPDGSFIDLPIDVETRDGRATSNIPVGELPRNARKVQVVATTESDSGETQEEVSEPVVVDDTPPVWISGTSVQMPQGTAAGYFTRFTYNLFSWPTAADVETPIVDYSIAVGRSPGSDEFFSWRSTGGTGTSFAASCTGMTNGTLFYVSVTAKNGAGLVSAPLSSAALTFDNEPPAFALLASPKNPTPETFADFAYTTPNETGCRFQSKLTITGWTDHGMSTLISYKDLPVGQHAISFRITDRAGNVTLLDRHHLWNIESIATPPTGGGSSGGGSKGGGEGSSAAN